MVRVRLTGRPLATLVVKAGMVKSPLATKEPLEILEMQHSKSRTLEMPIVHSWLMVTSSNKAAAVQRSCDIQFNTCADAINGGKLQRSRSNDCQTQECLWCGVTPSSEMWRDFMCVM